LATSRERHGAPTWKISDTCGLHKKTKSMTRARFPNSSQPIFSDSPHTLSSLTVAAKSGSADANLEEVRTHWESLKEKNKSKFDSNGGKEGAERRKETVNQTALRFF